jgi:hypothetical protein
MAKLLEVHKTSNIYGTRPSHRPLHDHRRRHRGHLRKREGEETMQFVIQGRETFMIMHQMINFDQEMTQNP